MDLLLSFSVPGETEKIAGWIEGLAGLLGDINTKADTIPKMTI